MQPWCDPQPHDIYIFPKIQTIKVCTKLQIPILAMCITDYNLWSFVLKRSKTSICKWLKAVHWIRQRILNLVSKIFYELTNEIVLIKQQQQINKQDFFWFVKTSRTIEKSNLEFVVWFGNLIEFNVINCLTTEVLKLAYL